MRARELTIGRGLEVLGAWLLAFLWFLPLLYAFWAAFHPAEYAINFELFAPLTLDNFAEAWERAPFARYFFNTFVLVSMLLVAQLVLCTLAAYAFARYDFRGKNIAFVLVLLQLGARWRPHLDRSLVPTRVSDPRAGAARRTPPYAAAPDRGKRLPSVCQFLRTGSLRSGSLACEL